MEEFAFVRLETAPEKFQAVLAVSEHAPVELHVDWRWPRLPDPVSEVGIAEGHLKVKGIRFEKIYPKSVMRHRLLLASNFLRFLCVPYERFV
jgi:hypothetical protein